MADGNMSPADDVLAAILGHAATGPYRAAAQDDSQSLTYEQLRVQVSRLASGLAQQGVGVGDRVGLQLPNSVDFLVAALASMWLGAIFVPLAVTDPAARVAAVVDDCTPAVILCNRQTPDPHPHAVQMIDLADPGTSDVPAVDAADLPAYAIYTSGTTGTPKGVLIGRRAFAAAVRSIIDVVGFTPSTRSLCVSPFHFDGSFGTLFPTPVAGGSLVIPPRESLLFPRYFFRTIARERITLTSFSPSYLRLLLTSPQLSTLAESTLRVVGLGGEACSAADVSRLWQAAPGLRVFNRYGPTETTIMASHFEVTPEGIAGDAVPIGRPHPGVSFILVDSDGDGRLIDRSEEVGELYIGGVQLMVGYWGAPELSASVLRSDIVAGQTVYRTGDIAMRRPDGNYVYVDRADRVIKRHAVRISLVELGEVFRSLPGVTAATCVTYAEGADLRIAAFVAIDNGATADDVRVAAMQRLPTTMLPDRIELVSFLPLNSSSKVDERRLLTEAGLRHR
jgi:amino acid adenylation domain-containing protein